MDSQPFKSFFRELQAVLGPNYALFQDFEPDNSTRTEVRQKCDNIGTLYVNDGSLTVLPDPMDALTAQCTLALSMKVPKSVNLSDAIYEPLYKLMKEFNGQSRWSHVDQKLYFYFVTVRVPTTDGNLIYGDGCYYVNYEIPFGLAVSQSGNISTNKNIRLKNDGGVWTEMPGVISAVEGFDLSLETNAYLNQKTNQSIALAASWSLTVAAYVLDPFHGMLWEWCVNHPTQKFELEYKGVRRFVVMKATYSSETGQFPRVTYTFFLAKGGEAKNCNVEVQVLNQRPIWLSQNLQFTVTSGGKNIPATLVGGGTPDIASQRWGFEIPQGATADVTIEDPDSGLTWAPIHLTSADTAQNYYETGAKPLVCAVSVQAYNYLDEPIEWYGDGYVDGYAIPYDMVDGVVVFVVPRGFGLELVSTVFANISVSGEQTQQATFAVTTYQPKCEVVLSVKPAGGTQLINNAEVYVETAGTGVERRITTLPDRKYHFALPRGTGGTVRIANYQADVIEITDEQAQSEYLPLTVEVTPL